VLRLPSGRTVRGRGLRDGLPAGPPPRFGLYALGHPPPEMDWESEWMRWRDFWLPADRPGFAATVRRVWERLADERVEIACQGGKGRTGTTLACLAVVDGVPATEAVSYVRANYHSHAVETPWQRRLVRGFQ